jgi:hypothetical protein
MVTWEQRLRDAEASVLAAGAAADVGSSGAEVSLLREATASLVSVVREIAAEVLPREPEVP